MNREPINPDDPQMSAYALGELSVAEAAEFEARLQDSPLARAELASMREIMTLLGVGLRKEWREEACRPTLLLLEPFDASRNPKVVEGAFRPTNRRLAAVASIAAVLVVGAVAILKHGELSERNRGVLVAVVEEAPVQESGLLPVGGGVPAHVPQLFLAEEIDDVSSLDLVVDLEDPGARIDPSYLDSDQIIPASFVPGKSQTRVLSPERGHEYDRVDSYLPPLNGIAFSGGLKTGMIEKRLSKDKARVGLQQQPAGSVLVSGYVTMGGLAQERMENGVHGFRPVSISANPVVDEDRNLQILADLNGLENDLSNLFAELPEESVAKADLERILEKSRRVLSQLQGELSR